MGIRFLCPNGHKLNVKSFLAGRRGICPHCGERFYIPNQSTPDLRVTAVQKRDDHRRPESPVGTGTTSEVANSEGLSEPNTGVGVWYVRGADGEQYGPADDRMMQQWLHEGRVPSDALVWRDPWTEWQPARDVFEQNSQPIGSEFDFDPNWLQPAKHVTPSEANSTAEVAALPDHSRFRPQNRTMIVGLILAVIALVPAVIYVLWRSMGGP
jgi:hypothetical protein